MQENEEMSGIPNEEGWGLRDDRDWGLEEKGPRVKRRKRPGAG